jgi:hypothetical protein
MTILEKMFFNARAKHIWRSFYPHLQLGKVVCNDDLREAQLEFMNSKNAMVH